MKNWLAGLALALAAASPAWAQEGQPAPGKPEEEELTPEKAIQLLKETQGLMAKAEELLNESSRGKAIETEKGIVERINELLKDEPQAAQKKALEKIERLMSKSEGSQKNAIDKIDEIIKKAKSCQGGSCNKPGDPQQGQKPQQQGQKSQAAKQPSSPAQSPYDPNRNDPANIFRSKGDRSGRWGDLPPRIREAMFNGKRDLDDFPPEYQQLLKEYFQGLLGEKQ
jgi:uncharacterized protein YoaH (UPF0181 family)